MKYIVVRVRDGNEWRARTIGVTGAEPLTEPTEQERALVEHENALDQLSGGQSRLRRRMRPSTVEAWDAGCRTIIHGSQGGDEYYVRTPFEVINNHLDALNLIEDS